MRIAIVAALLCAAPARAAAAEPPLELHAVPAAPRGAPLWTLELSVGPYAPLDETAPLVTVELERHVVTRAGSVGAIASAGFTQVCARQSPHELLRLVPLSLGAVYRTPPVGPSFAPLVASAKLGLAYSAWSLAGERGGKLGWRAAAGLALRLDALDPIAARAMARDHGVDHVALSVELTYLAVDGFEQPLTWTAGLDLDF